MKGDDCMKEIINYLPVLAIMITLNILLGTVYNTSVREFKFDKYTLLDGIKKAVSIGLSFIGLAYAFDVVEIGGDIVTPQLIMVAAITLYVGKVTGNLMKILGVDNILNKKDE